MFVLYLFPSPGYPGPMDDIPLRTGAHRGAVSNAVGRFEAQEREAFDDGWGSAWDEDLPPPRTTVQDDSTRSILARNDSPDLPFDRSINPYRGCEHGCIYCFARPTHAFLGLSPGLDFETRLFAKPDAPALLDKELSRKGYVCRPIAIGTNTDPYQPVERQRRIMRGVLEVLAAWKHPVAITTKSGLVARDADILGPMAAQGLASVALSVTTLDRDLARSLEPRASPPLARLKALRALADAGVPVAVMVAPVIPGLTDHELESILEAAHDHGARAAEFIVLRLPGEVADLFAEWLEARHPRRAGKVLSLVRQIRGGALYDSRFGDRMSGQGPLAQVLAQRFAGATRRLGMTPARWTLRNDLFSRPPRAGDQMALF
ncbi:MAG: hypothetical protein VR70_09390 [Rhodospirillaceae bacterium BRH_c57]|nr:MAG: hypothetical protein VR70_09390 [Rhodospirillaceae bacterium BRH_c57]